MSETVQDPVREHSGIHVPKMGCWHVLKMEQFHLLSAHPPVHAAQMVTHKWIASTFPELTMFHRGLSNCDVSTDTSGDEGEG